jgi:hypothetical protein
MIFLEQNWLLVLSAALIIFFIKLGSYQLELGHDFTPKVKTVNNDYHDRKTKFDLELHRTRQQNQWGTHENEFSEYGHDGRSLALVNCHYGGASSDLSLISDLVARKLARERTVFYNIDFSETKVLFKQKLARKWGITTTLWRVTLLGRLRDLLAAPFNVSGNSSVEHIL